MHSAKVFSVHTPLLLFLSPFLSHLAMLIHPAIVAVLALLRELLLGSGAWLGSMPDRASIHEEINNTAKGLNKFVHFEHDLYHRHVHYEAYGGHWKPMLDYVVNASNEPKTQQLQERAVLPVFSCKGLPSASSYCLSSMCSYSRPSLSTSSIAKTTRAPNVFISFGVTLVLTINIYSIEEKRRQLRLRARRPRRRQRRGRSLLRHRRRRSGTQLLGASRGALRAELLGAELWTTTHNKATNNKQTENNNKATNDKQTENNNKATNNNQAENNNQT